MHHIIQSQSGDRKKFIKRSREGVQSPQRSVAPNDDDNQWILAHYPKNMVTISKLEKGDVLYNGLVENVEIPRAIVPPLYL